MGSLVLLAIGKLIVAINTVFKFGSGSTWPGNLALKIDKNFIRKMIKKNRNLKTVVVIGTNGKTTTVSLIRHAISNLGFKVFSNNEGANLTNGIASTLIKNSDLLGNLKFDFGVFEVDEFSFSILLKELIPDVVVVLNLFRDQLDRYGEVNTVGSRWFNSLKILPKESMLLINGDDPYLYYSSKDLVCKKVYFGIDLDLMKIKNIPHDVDFIYCPACTELLTYERIAYAHLGNYYCLKCGFKRQEIENFPKKINYPLEGLYNIYNVNATVSLMKEYFGRSASSINTLINGFKPAFGRQEEIYYQGKRIFILLSKNPAGFNQSIKAVSSIIKNKKSTFLILLNDRIPDGRDVSWIWDVDFTDIVKKAKNIIVSGDRVYDMALRLKYESVSKKMAVFENLNEALKFSLKKINKDKLYVLTTYSAMLEVRKILTGKKFL